MLLPKLIESPAPRTLGELSLKIMQQAEWAHSPLLPVQRQQLSKLRVQLYRNDGTQTPGYQRYLDYKHAYDDFGNTVPATRVR
jgi:hypothetical protein